MDPEDTELLMREDVQKFLWVLNGLLDGTKKLVIETTYHHKDGSEGSPANGPWSGHTSMKHTFRIEDAKSE